MATNQSAPFHSRRVVVTRYGGPEVLQVIEEHPPEPKPGEARVRILAAGVSYADLLMREGVHPEAPRPPFTVGWDLVGVVNRVGPGDEAVRPAARAPHCTDHRGAHAVARRPAGA